ncbi:MAG: pitrilysin family protein [Acutalibacteraceae bacterium]|nr:pitrilysin family protein [Acutalibacteraceae bacterium]
MSEKIISLSEGAEGLFIKTDRFKTTLISFNFYLPLKKETVAEFALLPFILTSCSKKYPDFSQLNYKLSRLYGARLDSSAEKYGDWQLLKMTVSVINDRYSLDGESLANRACDMLLGLIFEPSTENGAFLENDVSREKRKAIEHIKGEISEKRILAKNRLIEEMYKDEPYGVPKCGTVEDVEKITGSSLYTAWQNMLKTAFIRVNVVGSSVPSGFFERISENFALLDRKDITLPKISAPTKENKTVSKVTDRMDVKQGKLCLGFSSEMYGNDDDSLPLMIMCDIFGGGPYSRLFSNVREKMSLCYYCSASAVRQKGLITVESGIETENAEKAEKEILNQLETVKKGEFTDFEFESSIKSVCDSLSSYGDSQAAIDTWYTMKINNNGTYSPTEIAERIKAITRDEVTAAAKGVKLHTVYKLLPKEEK